MGQPYVGEIRMFGGNFAPVGWMFCSGQLLPISDYDTLFNLIGTTYGGDGQTTFALPDLQSRVPIHTGTQAGITYTLGETGGVENVTLTTQQIPSHTHAFVCSSQTGTSANPGGNVLDQTTGTIFMYVDGTSPDGGMAPGMLSPDGGSQPHTNIQPYLTINFIISLYGVYPSPT